VLKKQEQVLEKQQVCFEEVCFTSHASLEVCFTCHASLCICVKYMKHTPFHSHTTHLDLIRTRERERQRSEGYTKRGIEKMQEGEREREREKEKKRERGKR